ncbi:hypothetical protein BSM4216_0273 [Bacillus smithii]|nr:hypothetical protein BSM4216_0273 [Bacillus smithii]
MITWEYGNKWFFICQSFLNIVFSIITINSTTKRYITKKIPSTRFSIYRDLIKILQKLKIPLFLQRKFLHKRIHPYLRHFLSSFLFYDYNKME